MLPPTVSVSARNGYEPKRAELLIGTARSVNRDFDLSETAWRRCGNRCANRRQPVPDQTPSAIAKNDDGDRPTRQVLLVPEVPVRRHEHVEPGGFGGVEQFAVSVPRRAVTSAYRPRADR
jgi:hypothetical protein